MALIQVLHVGPLIASVLSGHYLELANSVFALERKMYYANVSTSQKSFRALLWSAKVTGSLKELQFSGTLR